VWAAFFNFIAFLIFGTAVAKTIGQGMIDISIVTEWVVLAGLLGAISWNMITWYFGLPSSSSHALIGGYAGASKQAGLGVIIAAGGIKHCFLLSGTSYWYVPVYVENLMT
jgi:PiT family inorganic phosphate transporter